MIIAGFSIDIVWLLEDIHQWWQVLLRKTLWRFSSGGNQQPNDSRILTILEVCTNVQSQVQDPLEIWTYLKQNGMNIRSWPFAPWSPPFDGAFSWCQVERRMQCRRPESTHTQPSLSAWVNWWDGLILEICGAPCFFETQRWQITTPNSNKFHDVSWCLTAIWWFQDDKEWGFEGTPFQAGRPEDGPSFNAVQNEIL